MASNDFNYEPLNKIKDCFKTVHEGCSYWRYSYSLGWWCRNCFYKAFTVVWLCQWTGQISPSRPVACRASWGWQVFPFIKYERHTEGHPWKQCWCSFSTGYRGLPCILQSKASHTFCYQVGCLHIWSGRANGRTFWGLEQSITYIHHQRILRAFSYFVPWRTGEFEWCAGSLHWNLALASLFLICFLLES